MAKRICRKMMKFSKKIAKFVIQDAGSIDWKGGCSWLERVKEYTN